MRKRSFPMYVFLNCLTLGVYGFVVAIQMNKEIDSLCNGDDQKPAVGFAGVNFLRLIPVFGSIYYLYYWYQQANRLKLNAGRYRITVKESGTDIFLMRTVLAVPMFALTAVEIGLSLLIPYSLSFLLAWAAENAWLFIIPAMFFSFVLYLFSGELTFGATISNYYIMKNLNRFADVYRNGSEPFDPMGYEYYPSISQNYPNCLPTFVSGTFTVSVGDPGTGGVITEPTSPTSPTPGLIGIDGTCAGYNFDISSGEEIIVGKDAKVSMVIIEPEFKEISRKHFGVSYDIVRDQYCVVDYSSNGTWANGTKLIRGQETYLPHGTELKLANGKNSFRLS